MNRELADKIAKATLYEGYILYPYRPSVKNQQRWTFGGIYPRSWNESGNGTDLHTMQTEVLVAGTGDSSLRVIIRFLHLVDRTVGKSESQIVELLELGDTRYRPWQEAIEREVDAGDFQMNDLVSRSAWIDFNFPQSARSIN